MRALIARLPVGNRIDVTIKVGELLFRQSLKLARAYCSRILATTLGCDSDSPMFTSPVRTRACKRVSWGWLSSDAAAEGAPSVSHAFSLSDISLPGFGMTSLGGSVRQRVFVTVKLLSMSSTPTRSNSYSMPSR